jgi:prepilin-type N-terminal cleavage/methylation domain-containing protein/prepilin-type processing-associated H-X9-DG protein
VIRKRGFTLIELLVVVAIIAILIAILLPSLSRAKEYARKGVCGSNNRQIANALQMYAKDYNGQYPLAWRSQDWQIEQDGPGNQKMGWMRRLFPYVQNREVYKCPSFPREDDEFHYFLGCRAAYVRAIARVPHVPDGDFAPVRQDWIEYPSAYVMGGDCNRKFLQWDCDRDDYNHQCQGWMDMKKANPQGFADNYWDPWHDGGLNVIFADAHVQWYTQHVGREMTYSYGEYTDWSNAR